MTPKRKEKLPLEGSAIEANFSGTVSGQVAIGSNISQMQNIKTGLGNLTEDERQTLSTLISALKEKIADESPPDKKDPALEQVAELEQAINAPKPDVSTMEHVKNWFVSNIPQLAGAVTGLVVNPIVGKLVEAAGETIAHEFKLRFGTPEHV